MSKFYSDPMIGGPSKTADIEGIVGLDAHGSKALNVVIWR
jgi:L-lactate utilization protein LutC